MGRPKQVDAGKRNGGIRVLTGADSWHQARALEQALAADPTIATVGHGFTAAEVVELAASHAPDVAVLHVDRPELGLLEACRDFEAHGRGPAVVVVSSQTDDELGREALAAGSSAFVVIRAEASDDALAGAVHAVASGYLVLDGGLRPLLAGLAATAPAPGARAGLTPRELEMLPLLAEGHRNKEIGRILGLSEQTVRNHLSRMYRKLGAGNRTQMIAEARRRGILD